MNSSHEFHSEKFLGYTIRIVQEECPENPRNEYSNVGSMGSFYSGGPNKSRWNTRDDLMESLADFMLRAQERLLGKEYLQRGWGDLSDEDTQMPMPEFDELVNMADTRHVLLGYSRSSHSGVYENDDVSNCDGYIWCSLDEARKHWPSCKDDKELREKTAACLRSELYVYGKWCIGEVAGWTVTKGDDDEVLGSGWGYYPDEYPHKWDYPIEEAKDAIKSLIAENKEEKPSVTDLVPAFSNALKGAGWGDYYQ